jgi:hypothetical protein
MRNEGGLRGPGGMRIAVLAAVLLLLLPVITNPGFFSHDEWQKHDDIARFGLLDYLARYASLPRGADFGHPVRPVSFAVQGLAAMFMAAAPAVTHLIDVMMHLGVVALIHAVLVRMTGDRRTAWAAAMVFAVSPLAMPSVVWSAALMDRLYVLWGLLGLLAFERYVARGGHPAWLLAGAAAGALAVLSKETAIVLPGALFAWAILQPQRLRERRFWAAAASWVLPGLLFLWWRLPALLNTLGGAGAASYTVSPWHIPQGVFLYFAFPFVPQLTEAVNWVFVPGPSRLAAVAVHAALVAAIAGARGWRAAAAYLWVYFVLLLPVLAIPSRGAHYLYGPGLAFAAGLAVLLSEFTRWPQRARWTLAACALAVSVVHTAQIHLFAHEVGVCTSRAMATTQGAYVSAGRPAALHFTADADARGYMLHRVFTHRHTVGPYHEVRLLLDGDPGRDAAQLRFDAHCTVSLQARAPGSPGLLAGGPARSWENAMRETSPR